MARPRSADKRQAILDAAVRLISDQGVNVPTARIAQMAGVAEGTLFTYFPSKDDLLDQLYLDLKAELWELLLKAYPKGGTLRKRSLHTWRTFVAWAVAHPERRALTHLELSGRVNVQAKAVNLEAYLELERMLEESVAMGELSQRSPAFVRGIICALAGTTVDAILQDPDQAETITASGFEAMWNALANPKALRP